MVVISKCVCVTYMAIMECGRYELVMKRRLWHHNLLITPFVCTFVLSFVLSFFRSLVRSLGRLFIS